MRVLFAALLLFPLASCAQFSGPRFDQGPARISYSPATALGESGKYFRVPGDSQGEAVANVAAALKNAGYAARVDGSHGVISGTTKDAGLLDCGSIQLINSGPDTTFAATTAKAVYPIDDGNGLQIVRRLFSSDSKFRVIVRKISNEPGYAARIEEHHHVRSVVEGGDGKTAILKRSASFAHNQSVEIDSGLNCLSTGKIRKVVRQGS